jgi:hypothetical protein
MIRMWNVDMIVTEEEKLKMQSLKNSSMAERLVLFISLLQLWFLEFLCWLIVEDFTYSQFYFYVPNRS